MELDPASVRWKANIGFAAIALGVLGVIGKAPLVLSLVGLLAVGASVLIAGTVARGRMVGMVGKQPYIFMAQKRSFKRFCAVRYNFTEV